MQDLRQDVVPDRERRVRTIAATALGTMFGKIRRFPSIIWKAEALARGVRIEGSVVFLGRPIISVWPGSKMVFSGRNQFASSRRCNPLGNSQPCVLRTLAPEAVLQLGIGVGASAVVLCAAKRIDIGEGTILGSGSMIIDNDFHLPEGEFGWTDNGRATAKPISIGRGCFVGTRALILKGVTIGDRARIGAGAVVSSDVPAGALAVGNPARIVMGG